MPLIGLLSCKKGKDDPFLSVRSRDARLQGKWKLISLNHSITDIDDQSVRDSNVVTTNTFVVTTTNNIEFDGTTLTNTETTKDVTTGGNVVVEEGNSVIRKSTLSVEVTIDKEGAFEVIWEKTPVSRKPCDTCSTITSIYSLDNPENGMVKGVWFWQEGKKKKSHVTIDYSGYNAGDLPIYTIMGEITRLANKEIQCFQNRDDIVTSTSYSESTNTSTVRIHSFKEEITSNWENIE